MVATLTEGKMPLIRNRSGSHIRENTSPDRWQRNVDPRSSGGDLSPGRSGLRRLTLGNNAEQVLRAI